MDGASGSPARSRTRIGDRERERLLVVLREHYADGRLSLDEVRRRTEIVVCATYADEADRALAELPAITAQGAGAQGTGETQPQRRGLLSRRGHAEVTRPAPGWVRTDERFRDPSSGVVMRVWLDPGDGSRHYVPDNAG
ncbi:MAG: DUF1707 SHOCT-like domain-containing protein [Trebonia sp.]